jgi:acetyl-CoA carboxylase biotin carboxyl carrier protein
MTIDEIKELIRVVHETGIGEVEWQRGENRVCIRSSVPAVHQEVLTHYPVAPVSAPASPLSVSSPSPVAIPAAAAPALEMPEDTGVVVKSPIVGTYYDSASPGAAPFVKVGDQVEPGKVLCIIESMKLMNEIEAEIAGTVTAKFIENGKPVEYGESLFTIRPR